MTLTELRYIVAVARERHFGRAADASNVSQPTLSMGVKRLEQELGVILFERGKHDITLTVSGERIIAQARRTLEEADQLRLLAMTPADPLAQPLHIGAIHTVGPFVLPSLVASLHALAPSMPLIIEEDYTADLTEKLKRGQLDAIIVALPFSAPGTIIWPLYDEPFFAALPSSHPLLAQASISLDELASQDILLLGHGHCFREQVLALCPQREQDPSGLRRPPPGTTVGGSLETIRHMVASGMGVTILPSTAARVDQYNQQLMSIRSLPEPVPRRRIVLVWRKRFHRQAAIEKLREAVLNCQLNGVEMIDSALYN